MGSTVVLVWIHSDKAYWTHVGDSRLYLMREGELHQLSEDHSLVQDQLKRGIISAEEAKTHSLRHVVTKAIGSRDPFQAEVREHLLASGDILMLCCDGLSNKVEHQLMREILQKGHELQRTCQILVDAANETGGEDNITVVLCQYAN